VDPETAPRHFKGVAVVSGNMKDTEAYWTDTHVERILHAFKRQDKVIGAICCSVPTLAPVATNTKVSFFPLVRSRHRLQLFGAILQTVSLTVDKKVITAENQMISQMWGEEICNAIEGKPPQFTLTDSGYSPKGRPRRLHPEIQSAIDQANAANRAQGGTSTNTK
jgi:putative intracellular protease/amidase